MSVGLLRMRHEFPERFPAPLVMPNLQYDEWGDAGAMEDFIRKLVREGEGTGPISADNVPIHELGHAFHDQNLRAIYPESRDPLYDVTGRGGSSSRLARLPAESTTRNAIRSHLGKYALTNPNEFVAEAFTNQMLRGEPLSPALRTLYQDLHGPDLDKLPPEFLKAWWDLPRL
jgi:hypothetical protein